MTELVVLSRDRYEQILSHGALDFVLDLVQTFAPRVEDCLAARERRQIEIDRGTWPDLGSVRPKMAVSSQQIANACRYAKGPCVELTGQPTLDAIRAAATAGADGYVADFEDSLSPSWDNLMSGQACLHKYIHSGGLANGAMMLWIRPRSWHALEMGVTYQDKSIPGALLDFGVFLFGNAEALKKYGQGACFSLPKIESHEEAQLWSDIFEFSASHDISKGVAINAIPLIETVPAMLELDEIVQALRGYLAGLACDRTDYAFSFAKCFHGKPRSILPDRVDLTPDTDFLRAYTQQLVDACHRNGILAVGDTDKVLLSSRDEAIDVTTNQALSMATRNSEDGFNVTGLVEAGLVSAVRDAISKAEGITSSQQQSSLVNVTGIDALLHVTGGRITESGVRRNIRDVLQVLGAWLAGFGSVDVDNNRLSLCDVELSRTQLWQWIQHATGILDEGREVDVVFVSAIIGDVLDELCDSPGGEFDEEKYKTAAKLLQESLRNEVLQPFLLNAAISHLRH